MIKSTALRIMGTERRAAISGQERNCSREGHWVSYKTDTFILIVVRGY